MSPDLEREQLRRFERWLDDAIGRHAPPLSFSELRKGVQALSSLYVERRAAGPIAPRARDGHGKRAAFATYYAALHFLTAHHALQQIGAQRFGDVRRVHDLGCGTASAGAAIASGLPGAPDVRASDAAGWVLSEARHTLAAFGIPGTVRRAPLRAALARARGGDLVLFAWVLNELSDATRDETVRGLRDACRRGCRLLVLEPLARPACPWWPTPSRRRVTSGLLPR